MSVELRGPISRLPLYRRQWFKRAAIIVVAALFLVVVIAIVLFLLWWNSPEKALLDAADYGAKTPGTYHVLAKDTDATITFRDNEYAIDGTLDGAQIQAILFGNTLFVKTPSPNQLYNLLMGTSSQQIPAIITAILPTVANQWISVNLDNTNLGAKSFQTSQCLIDEKESIAHDPNARRQWGSAYLSHRFLSITTAQKGSSKEYDVSVNASARDGFFSALQKTSFYESLTNCSKNTDALRSLGEGQSPAAAITFVSGGQHILQSMVLNPSSNDPINITTNYKDVPTISLPTKSISSDELVVRYLQSVGGSLTNL